MRRLTSGSGDMSISIEKARELLAHPPSIDTARALKEWRAQAGYSQTEAAIRLGVPVRTLQGWELGRTMPYPTLLQRAAGFSARSADRYSLVQSDFPREFAEFIDFVGAHALDKEIRKIEQRFGAGVTAAESSTRALYGDRYFFQEQCTRFTHDIPAFGLNISDPTAVRAASLIAGINRVRSFRFSNAGSPSTVVCGGVGPAFENLSCTKPRAVEAGSSRARYGDLGEAGGRCRRARPAFDAVGNDSGGSSLWKFRSWPASQSNFSWPSCFERASGGSKAEFGRRRRARDSAKEWRCKANHEAASIMTCRS